MNMRHLHCFVAVAEELHFGRAARRLHIEQSPLSRTIRKLEENLGTTLLERTLRGVRLTSSGQVLLEDARRLLRVCDQVRRRTRAASEDRQPSLRVAVESLACRAKRNLPAGAFRAAPPATAVSFAIRMSP